MPSWVEKTSRFSKDGALIPRSIRLRKSTEIWSNSANCSWLMLRANRMALRRLPNFSRRADKHCTCGLNVAHTQVSNHRMSDIQRSEEHTSELQSHSDLVCRLLLEKKKNTDCICDTSSYM